LFSRLYKLRRNQVNCFVMQIKHNRILSFTFGINSFNCILNKKNFGMNTDKKILIVGIIEDAEFVELLKRTTGGTVLFANDGEEALKIAFRVHPEFVFLGKFISGNIDEFTTANIISGAYNIPVLFVLSEDEIENPKFQETPYEVVFTPSTGTKLKFHLGRAKSSITRFKKLSEETELLNKILSNSPGFVIALDDRLTVKFANYGRNGKPGLVNEIVGLKFTDMLELNDKNNFLETINKLDCGISNYENINLNISYKENKFSVSCNVYCIYLSDGSNEFILYCSEKESGKHVTEEKVELFSVLENVPYGVAVISGEKFEFVNSEFIRITGYSKHELVNLQDWFEKAFPDSSYRKVVTDTWNSEIDKNNIIKTLSIQCKNGDIKQIDFRAGKIDNNKFIISILDITEQRKTREALDNYIRQLKLSKDSIEQKNIQLEKLNKELRESEEKLLELNRDKDKFFSILAHDLRTPFNAILGLSQLVAEEYDELTKEEVVKIVKDINSAGKNLFRLLENLLNWSRITSGRAEFNPEKVDLFELVLNAIHLLKPNADAKEIKIENNVKPDTYVFVDEQMIESVIENLLTNAIKFTPRGGRISINISEQPDKYEISVSDTGVGISKENIGKLFRIDKAFSEYGTEKEKGSGLGLILCKESVEKHNGKIWVESEEGKGSTFYFTVPKAK